MIFFYCLYLNKPVVESGRAFSYAALSTTELEPLLPLIERLEGATCPLQMGAVRQSLDNDDLMIW